MAKIKPDQLFDADSFDLPVIGITAEMSVHDSGYHSHQRHQLLFSTAGCITIELEQTLCLLPPGRAAWIPAGTVHRALMRGVPGYRSLYFLTSLPFIAPPIQILEVNSLFFEVIDRMANWSWDMPATEQTNLLNVFIDELQTARNENWRLPFPQDKRMALWLDDVRGGEMPPRLSQLAQRVAASERTVSRIFIRDTGMNYRSWRQQWRLLKAMEMLAEGKSISIVAQQLEFISDSAFIAFFRQLTGVTPARYIRPA